ncbi:MAG TPA: SRPBCC family protein [Actinomycetales bacterium]|nr:SRPBCC family protein [Actinomycetales bacterium]
MELQHTFTVPIGIDEAWDAFNDIERIAPCLPGAEITSVDGDEFTGLAKVRLGPVSLQYTGTGRWLERDRGAYRAVLEANGKDRRGNGTAGATIRAHLEREGDGTKVVVDTDLKITGRPAQFGRGVIQDVGTKLLDEFAACLATRLGGEEPEAPPAEARPEPGLSESVPSGGEPSGGRPSEARAVVAQAEQLAEQAEVAAEQSAVAAQAPARAAGRPTPAEIDLGRVAGPALLRRYGGTAVAVVLAVVVTWAVTRLRARRR